MQGRLCAGPICRSLLGCARVCTAVTWGSVVRSNSRSRWLAVARTPQLSLLARAVACLSLLEGHPRQELLLSSSLDPSRRLCPENRIMPPVLPSGSTRCGGLAEISGCVRQPLLNGLRASRAATTTYGSAERPRPDHKALVPDSFAPFVSVPSHHSRRSKPRIWPWCRRAVARHHRVLRR
jgi:hypothetical protein